MACFMPASCFKDTIWTTATTTGVYVSVKVEQGTLRGQEKISKFFPDKKYYSFERIPYAKPPEGPLRFKDPEEPEPWTGVRDAVAEEPEVPKPLSGKRLTVIDQFVRPPKLNDDCLYLDVDTPQVDDNRRPVIAWIHPMRFSEESAFGPQYFGVGHYMEDDIVLVTIKYRQNVLGFLCLDHEEVPGNAGLKDQVMALKWIQRNIAKFGGDPNNVTLYGLNIAAAFVHYHLMSPLSEGLYHRVIIQGDCALNPHVFVPREVAIKKAFRLGKVLEWDTDNTDDLLEFLRAVPTTELAEAARMTYDDGENQFGFGMPFVPCVEVPATDRSFLPLAPKELLRQGRFAKVPVMMGTTNHQGRVSLALYRENEGAMCRDDSESAALWKVFLVGNPRINEDSREWIKEVEKFYFGHNPSTDEFPSICGNLICDFSYNIGYDEAVQLQLEHTQESVYAFQFELFNIENPMKPLMDGKYWNLYGENIVYHRLIKMWTSFAKTSNPNSETTVEEQVMWEPAKRDSFSYLEITHFVKVVKERIAESRIKMWHQVHEKYPEIRETHRQIYMFRVAPQMYMFRLSSQCNP